MASLSLHDNEQAHGSAKDTNHSGLLYIFFVKKNHFRMAPCAHHKFTVRTGTGVEADLKPYPSQGAGCSTLQGCIPGWL